ATAAGYTRSGTGDDTRAHANACLPHQSARIVSSTLRVSDKEKRLQIEDLQALLCIWRSERDSNPR
ncbi:hypothetical protein, partial [Stenotrophomonas maltophilia]|uniref:hypothetical protein n=1 Tax=Stenotrophomonas maltophilia TaxID=40324 RepID=UPI001F203C5C